MQGSDGKRHWGGIPEAVRQVKPTLLETVYGLDVIVPGENISLWLACNVTCPCADAML